MYFYSKCTRIFLQVKFQRRKYIINEIRTISFLSHKLKLSHGCSNIYIVTYESYIENSLKRMFNFNKKFFIMLLYCVVENVSGVKM